MPASGNRQAVILAIEAFWDEVHLADADVLVVVTSRPQGYQEALSRRHWEHWELAPLSAPQSRRIAERLADVRLGVPCLSFGPARPSQKISEPFVREVLALARKIEVRSKKWQIIGSLMRLIIRMKEESESDLLKDVFKFILSEICASPSETPKDIILDFAAYYGLAWENDQFLDLLGTIPTDNFFLWASRPLPLQKLDLLKRRRQFLPFIASIFASSGEDDAWLAIDQSALTVRSDDSMAIRNAITTIKFVNEPASITNTAELYQAIAETPYLGVHTVVARLKRLVDSAQRLRVIRELVIKRANDSMRDWSYLVGQLAAELESQPSTLTRAAEIKRLNLPSLTTESA